MQYPIKLKMSDGTEKTFWLSDEKLQFGGTDDSVSDVQINGASIVQDGVAEIPLADRNVKGISALDYQYGIWKMSDGSLRTYGANDAQIDAMSDAFCPVVPSKIPRAVKAALTDSNKMVLTDTEKAAACETIGTEPKKGEWVLKGIMANALTASVDLTGCTQLLIRGIGHVTADVSLGTNLYGLYYRCFRTNQTQFCAMYSDTIFGMTCDFAKIGNGESYLVMADNGSGYCWLDGKKIKDIKYISLANGNTSLVNDCNIEIYAR